MRTDNREIKRICGVKWTTLLCIAHVAAFSGWLTENGFRFFAAGKIDDRHQILPFISAYAFGILALFLCFGTPQKMRIFGKECFPSWQALSKRKKRFYGGLYAVLTGVGIMLAELAVGVGLEKLFGIKAWTYANVPLHITRYTSIPTTLGFSAGVTLFMAYGFPSLERVFDRVSDKALTVAACLVTVLLLLDYGRTLAYAAAHGKFPKYWSVRIWKGI